MAHYDFIVEEKPAQPAMTIKRRTKVENLPQVIGQSYMEIMAYLTENGRHPAGAPFTAYYNMDMQDLEVEIGFPVKEALPPKDDIIPSEIPAGKQLSCMYKGSYSKMEGVYQALTEYAEEQGLNLLGTSYEFYYNGPETPEEELLTKIVLPVK